MKCVWHAVFAALLVSALAFTPAPQDPPVRAAEQRPATLTFRSLDVFVDTRSTPLAAWQAEITLDGARLIGVEGGGVAAFSEAPRHDPKALQGGRVIVAALAVGDDLPSGRVRVARLHVALNRSPDAAFTPQVQGAVVADPSGQRLRAAVAIQPTPKTR